MDAARTSASNRARSAVSRATTPRVSVSAATIALKARASAPTSSAREVVDGRSVVSAPEAIALTAPTVSARGLVTLKDRVITIRTELRMADAPRRIRISSPRRAASWAWT